jgi:hypothetical protein
MPQSLAHIALTTASSEIWRSFAPTERRKKSLSYSLRFMIYPWR